MRRLLLPVAALFVAAIPLGLRPSAGFAAATCFGKPATIVPADGDYFLTAGDDVVVGTDGEDEIITTSPGAVGGSDRICTGGGEDNIHPEVSGGTVWVDAGTGDDHVHIGGTGTADVSLGSGNDFGQTNGLGGIIRGGSGNDTLFAQGTGIFTGFTVDGGSGNDLIQSSSADVIYGGSGADRVIDQSAAGASLVDCGSAFDGVDAPNAATVRRCEGPVF